MSEVDNVLIFPAMIFMVACAYFLLSSYLRDKTSGVEWWCFLIVSVITFDEFIEWVHPLIQ